MGKVFWFLTFINIAISIVLPIFIFPKIIYDMTSQDSLIFGIITFILADVIEIHIYVSFIFNQKKEEERIIKLNGDSDRKLFNIMQNIHSINNDSFLDYDLFRFYLQKSIDEVYELSSNAVNKHELKIEDNMIEVTNEMYYSAFIGDNNSIFRPMYICSDNDFFFYGFGKNYFMLAKKLVDQKKIKKVMRLFVYEKSEELSDEKIKKLIYFHNKTRNYDCRVLSMARYVQIRNDFRLTDISGSFAVYGSRYLYTERMAPTVSKQIGYYSKDKGQIETYTRFFERCWQQANRHDIVSQKCITVEDVFDDGWNL